MCYQLHGNVSSWQAMSLLISFKSISDSSHGDICILFERLTKEQQGKVWAIKHKYSLVFCVPPKIGYTSANSWGKKIVISYFAPILFLEEVASHPSEDRRAGCKREICYSLPPPTPCFLASSNQEFMCTETAFCTHHLLDQQLQAWSGCEIRYAS